MIWIGWTVATIGLYYFGIKWCHKFQFHQTIYSDSPEQHQKKRGTPTMGGVFIATSFITGLCLLNHWNLTVFWIVITSSLFCLIGFIDDALAIRNRSNKGISAKVKFCLQVIFSCVMVWWFHSYIESINMFEYALYVFLLTGTSNATNLTDGIDGLLSSTMLVSLTGLILLLQKYWINNELYIVLIMMASIGIFLLFNWNPAKIFMGDTGSLMLGGFLASVCIASGQWMILIGLGGVYIVETLSVIIQVIYYKINNKRVFLMSPIHHHFEILGLNERHVVILFIGIQMLFTLVQVSL